MVIPLHNTSFFNNQTYTACIRPFNAPPTYLKQLQDVKKRKEELKKFFIRKKYYNVKEYLLVKEYL